MSTEMHRNARGGSQLSPSTPLLSPAPTFPRPDVSFPATGTIVLLPRTPPNTLLQFPKQHFLARSVPLDPSPPWLISLARIPDILWGILDTSKVKWKKFK